jgi:hypothetical protein
MRQVFHVVWTPGTDDLLGICHCGAEHLSDDPVEVWSWLLDHPAGHETPGTLPGRRVAAGAAR